MNPIFLRRSLYALGLLLSQGLSAQEREPQNTDTESIEQLPALAAQQRATAAVALEKVIKRADVSPIDAQTGVGTLDQDALARPVTIQSVDTERFRDAGGRRISDIQDFLPAVFSSSGDAEARLDDNLSIRGFENFYVLVNGVRHLRVDTGAVSIGNVERIEIIKGAAGLEAGTVEPGGAVNLVTKKPRGVAASSLELEGGSFERAGLLFDATGPLSPSLNGRVVVGAAQGGNFRKLPRDELLLAPSIAWQAGERQYWLLETSASYIDSGYDTGGFFVKNAGLKDNFAPRRFSYQDDESHNRNRELRAALYGRHGLAENTELLSNFSVEGRSTFTSGLLAMPDSLYAGGSDNSLEYSGDPVINRTPFERHNRGQRGVSGRLLLQHDLNFTSHRHRFGVGVQVNEDRFEQLLGFGATYRPQNVFDSSQIFPEQDTPYSPDQSVPPEQPFPGDEDEGGGGPMRSLFAGRIKQRSGFLQYVGDAGRWHWLAGVRRDRNSFKVDFEEDPEEGRMSDRFGSETNSVRAGLSYRLAESVVLYGSGASAYLPQGGVSHDGVPVQPSRARSGELGLRLRDGSERLFELNVFQVRVDHFAQPDPVENPFGFFQVDSGVLRSRGVELLAVQELPGDRRISLHGSYLDARIVSSTQGFDGRRQPNVPYASGGVRLFQGLSAVGLSRTGIELAAQYLGRRKPALFYQYDPDYELPEYLRLDLVLEHQLSARSSLQLYVENLLDKHYIAAAGSFPGYNFAGDPFSMTLSWRHRFD